VYQVGFWLESVPHYLTMEIEGQQLNETRFSLVALFLCLLCLLCLYFGALYLRAAFTYAVRTVHICKGNYVDICVPRLPHYALHYSLYYTHYIIIDYSPTASTRPGLQTDMVVHNHCANPFTSLAVMVIISETRSTSAFPYYIQRYLHTGSYVATSATSPTLSYTLTLYSPYTHLILTLLTLYSYSPYLPPYLPYLPYLTYLNYPSCLN